MPVSSHYRPAPEILDLDGRFYDAVRPAEFPKQELRFRNQRWAERLGLGELNEEEWRRHFALFEPLPKNIQGPLALRYHGHQFGTYNPQLGDGRGFLHAQVRDPVDGRLLDFATKGSGRTPYSRTGDGRLTLKGGVREVLATEMLEALGVYTSKSFSLFETGELLVRGDEPSPTRSSVLVRLSHSHIRFGSFQRHAYEGDTEAIRELGEFVIDHYLPEARELVVPGQGLFYGLLRATAYRAARTCAAWMAAGFVHGVLNTDNINVTGESFDYGPWRFLPSFDPAFTAAYFDYSGFYAYGRQPEAIHWNCVQLALALRRAAPELDADAALGDYWRFYYRAFEQKVLERLGLRPGEHIQNGPFVQRVVKFLAESEVEFERFFFDWYGGSLSRRRAMEGLAATHYQGDAWDAVLELMVEFEPGPETLERLESDYFAREEPCTMLIDEVEAIWEPIDRADDWSRFEAKVADIREMGTAYGRTLATHPSAP